MPQTKVKPQQREKSEQIYKRSCEVIPGGVNSPVRSFPGLNQTPLVIHSGYGDTLVDVDGNQYIDLCCSWGPLIHGHAHPLIVEAAQKRIVMGSSFGITTEIEAKLAAKIIEHYPSMDQIRFVSSGTEATMSALRLARGFTGRDLVVKFIGHYHGHADPFLVQAGSGVASLGNSSSSAGVPDTSVQHTICLPYNDFEAVENCFKVHGDKIGCVILEPIPGNMGLVEPLPGLLTALRELTTKHGALLIFDEVISGFRAALGGAQELYDLSPDITCLGKIIGGGFPAAAFGARKEIMAKLAPLGDVYQAGTLSGNPVAMEAGYQTIQLCERLGFYNELKEKTDLITEPLREMITEHDLNMCVNQIGSLFTLFLGQREINNIEDVKRCNHEQFGECFRFMFEQGIYLSPSQYEANFISMAHTRPHLIQVREALLAFLDEHR